MSTDALLPVFLPVFEVAFVGGGIPCLSSAFTHSSLTQSPSAHLDGDRKVSLIHHLACGRIASNGATFEMPS